MRENSYIVEGGGIDCYLLETVLAFTEIAAIFTSHREIGKSTKRSYSSKTKNKVIDD